MSTDSSNADKKIFNILKGDFKTYSMYPAITPSSIITGKITAELYDPEKTGVDKLLIPSTIPAALSNRVLEAIEKLVKLVALGKMDAVLGEQVVTILFEATMPWLDGDTKLLMRDVLNGWKSQADKIKADARAARGGANAFGDSDSW